MEGGREGREGGREGGTSREYLTGISWYTVHGTTMTDSLQQLHKRHYRHSRVGTDKQAGQPAQSGHGHTYKVCIRIYVYRHYTKMDFDTHRESIIN